MSQIHNIVKALKKVAADNPMAAALSGVGFLGTIAQGTNARRDVDRPFGLLTVERVGSVGNSSGTELVTYRVSLQVIVDELPEQAGAIIEMFHRYWDQLNALPDMDDNPDIPAFFEQIHPEESEAGELDQQDLGKDIIGAITSWTLLISETQPALETV